MRYTTLREHKLQVFENKIPREIFQPQLKYVGNCVNTMRKLFIFIIWGD
jgi:hypothetical protein